MYICVCVLILKLKCVSVYEIGKERKRGEEKDERDSKGERNLEKRDETVYTILIVALSSRKLLKL